jgi:hypothetical protein
MGERRGARLGGKKNYTGKFKENHIQVVQLLEAIIFCTSIRFFQTGKVYHSTEPSPPSQGNVESPLGAPTREGKGNNKKP